MWAQSFSCVRLFVTLWVVAPRLLCPWDFPGRNTGVDYHFPLWGISQARDHTRASCVSSFGRWILHHCTTRGCQEGLSSVESLSHVCLFVTPWTAAHPASLSFTNFQSLLRLMSIEPVMQCYRLILCRPLLFLPSTFSASEGGLVQFSSVAQSCLTLCDPMSFSRPGLPVQHKLPEPTQTHIH